MFLYKVMSMANLSFITTENSKKLKIWGTILIIVILIAGSLIIRLPKSMVQIMDNTFPESFLSASFFDDATCTEVPLNGVSTESFYSIFQERTLRKGSKYNAMPHPAIEIVVKNPTATYNIVIGKDNSICIANYECLEETRSFWIDESKQIYNRVLEKLIITQ